MIEGLWIIVLTWNDRADTAELLVSLAEAELYGARVLVVDNGSEPPVLDALTAEFPWISTLQNGSNLGYAGGNNRGAEFAIASNARYICFLNNDTVVSSSFVAVLSGALDLADRAIAVTPTISYFDDRDQIWFAGARLEPSLGRPVHTTPPTRRDEANSSTQLLTGCCLAMATDTWQLVGPFDEDMFLIFEDSDWSMRARSHGVTLAVLPEAAVAHKVSRSFLGHGSGLGYFYFVRNGAIFAARWMPGPGLRRFLIQSVVRPILRDLLSGHVRLAGGRLLLATCGVAAAITHSGGEAGPIAKRLAQSLHAT